jgi:hypothetical protein
VAPAFRAVPRHRCSTGFNSGLEHCGAYLQRVRGFWRAHSHGPEPAVHAPPCWSRRIVAQYICGHRAQHIMRTYHAVSHGRNWTRSEQPDAAHTEGILIDASRPATPPIEAAARRRRGTLAACKRVFGPPIARAATAVVGANILRARRSGDGVSMHGERGCRGAKERLQAATSPRLP